MQGEDANGAFESAVEDTMSSSTFQRFFRPGIRVMFDWTRFCGERWPIRLSTVTDLRVLGEFRLPWNFDSAGHVVKYDHADATPAVLREMPTRLAALDAERRKSIDGLTSAFTAERQRVSLVIPTYSLPQSGHLVLDGTHRLVALVLSRVPFTILTATVHGPLNRSVVPELRHWERS